MTLANLIRHIPQQRANLARHLPNQRAIARAFGPRTYRSTGEYAGMLSLGLLAGAALTLALAPKARRELQEKASERWDTLRTNMKKRQQQRMNGRDEARVSASAR